jgi:hypothetical protein
MAAEPRRSPDRFERAFAALGPLFAERGLVRYATFHEVNEGTPFPDGTEDLSGNVIDDQGRVFFFWTMWDIERGRPTFETWRPVTPAPDWNASPEYQQARRAVGLR